MTQTVKVPLEEFGKLYSITLSLETYFCYMEDNSGALKHMAPTFLEHAKELINQYNELINEKYV